MSSKDDLVRKRSARDILAYEDSITEEMEKVVQKIRERAKLLHTELDRHIANLISDLRKQFEQELVRIRHSIDLLKGGTVSRKSKSVRNDSIPERTPRYRSTPKSDHMDSVLNSSQLSSLPNTDLEEIKQFDKKELCFFQGEMSDKLFQKLLGHYTLETTSTISLLAPNVSIQPNRRSEVKLVKTFKVGDKSETVHAIAPVEDNQAWICCGWGSRNICLYDKNGQKRKTAILDIQINDATSFHDGKDETVLVSSFKEKSIKRLNPESLRTSDFAYISLFPGGLCSDLQSGIYVCFRDNYKRQATFGSRRMVAKLSKHGEIVSTIEKNDDQTNIFGYPFRIAVNVNGDVCVSDYGDGTRGVIIMQKDGCVKNLYRGPLLDCAPRDQQPFLPHGIVCDADGYILVSDWNNDCVHVLDRDGNFLLQLVNSKDGLEGPNALGIDRRGYLWVGDSHGVVRIFKYSIVGD